MDGSKNDGNSFIWVFLGVFNHRLSSTSHPEFNALPTPVGEITFVSTKLGSKKNVLAILFHISFEVHLNSKTKPTY